MFNLEALLKQKWWSSFFLLLQSWSTEVFFGGAAKHFKSPGGLVDVSKLTGDSTWTTENLHQHMFVKLFGSNFIHMQNEWFKKNQKVLQKKKGIEVKKRVIVLTPQLVMSGSSIFQKCFSLNKHCTRTSVIFSCYPFFFYSNSPQGSSNTLLYGSLDSMINEESFHHGTEFGASGSSEEALVF